MINNEIDYNEWDKIFKIRKEYEKYNSQLKISIRYESYTNEKGCICCSKCGIGSQIGTCSDCIGEKEYLLTNT
jgi:hypothetical protein